MYRAKQATLHVFIDLTKAFDTVRRTGLYKVAEKIRCPLKLLQMIHAFHDGMTVRVIFDGDIMLAFNLRCGIRKNCHRCNWYSS